VKTKPILGSEDKSTFRALLEAAAANPMVGVIANRFPWQTKMATEKLLDVAKAKRFGIRLLTGSCPEGFYDPSLAEKLRDCKKDGAPYVRVLVWQEKAEGISKPLLHLASEGVIDLHISGTDKFADQIPHFLLVGEGAFRQEAAHQKFGRDVTFTELTPTIPARIDFDDPETGKSLATLFDSIWGST